MSDDRDASHTLATRVNDLEGAVYKLIQELSDLSDYVDNLEKNLSRSVSKLDTRLYRIDSVED